MDEAEGERDLALSRACWKHDLAYIEPVVAHGFDLDTPVHAWPKRRALEDDWHRYPPLKNVRCLLAHVVQRALADKLRNYAFFRLALRQLPFSRASATLALGCVLTRPWTMARADHFTGVARCLVVDANAHVPSVRELSFPNFHGTHYDIPLRVYKILYELADDRNKTRRTILALYGIARFRIIPGLPIRDLVRFIGNTLLPLPL